MNIVILGAGEVGFNIAQRLATEGNDVSVVDNNAERLQRVADSMDVQTVLGHASHPTVLERAGAINAELLIAATVDDETNMLACQVAHSLFKVPVKMARVRNNDYVDRAAQLFGRDDLPIDLVISPEKEAAKAIVRRVQVVSAMDMQEFADGRICLLGIQVPPKSDLAGVSVADLHEVLPDLPINIVAHEHNDKWLVPTASTVLLSGDSIYVTLDSDDLHRFLDLIGLDDRKQTGRNVMIVGGGHVGYQVALRLHQMGHAVKIVEHNRDRAEWLAQHLDAGTVICGDALDKSLLEEESIHQMDDFLALTNDDEVNILCSMISRQYKVPHTVTLINREIYGGLVRAVGLTNVVSPRFTTAASILRHVRRGRIVGFSSLGSGELEVLEAEAMATSRIVAAPLAALRLPEHTIIGAIVRGDAVIIPDGGSQVASGDHVVMITHKSSLRAVERLFEVNLEFF
ncbi:MAG: Trk system potassium transporter TrkA [Mariprofundales bacterium]|nr:Trk system potassium transporter TrkA [Mariprofundales bacterium]